MTESANTSGEPGGDDTDVDDVDAAMDVGAPGQDTAVAEYLEEHPDDYQIEEIEDHEVLGIDAEVGREVPEPGPEPEESPPPVPGREAMSRLLDAERYAERVERRWEP
ncbi:hypothetical protein [Nocardiopsis sp. MG754419]|uniref:hypothetical protein n=1 Tax=Nocardiopsis sp. MG754419 TaxID=2259865 RepID=UPI001BAE441F|nr:hypothetical protein [Nocardiopsis sp. MG754419]MBR8742993.1 hypothetical protein [Nocardiopsis sp. MG754419]